jgi:phospholipid/cholesterol/gamma-HCH transport system substrate-binding protein
MRSAADKLDRLMDQLELTAQKTDRVATLLLEEDSTFGQLVKDRQLYDNLQSVAARADSLIADIRAHPKRFFSLSIF